jgi:hypothetical protein
MDEKILTPLLEKKETQKIVEDQGKKKVEKHKEVKEIQEGTNMINYLKCLKSNLFETLYGSNMLLIYYRLCLTLC